MDRWIYRRLHDYEIPILMTSPVEMPCPVCGRTEYEVLYRPWRTVTDPVKLFGAASGERGTQQIVRCKNKECRMVYANPRYSEDIILKGYEGAENQGHDTQHESRVLTFLRSRQKSMRTHFYRQRGQQPLLMWAARGELLSKPAGRYGYKATGLEPSHQLAASARERGLNVIQGTLETYHPTEKYDLVSLWDVLEHVTDPSAPLA